MARGSRWGARWGWLSTTLALGAALCVASWTNYRSVQDAVATLHQGQVRVFEGLVLATLRGRNPLDPVMDLDSLVAAQAEDGLRFVGILSRDTGLTVLGGTPLSEITEPQRLGPGPNALQVGDRLRFFLRMNPPRGPMGGGGAEPPGLLVLEFEPRIAGELMSQAGRSLILGVLAAALLMLSALFFWRATLRREAEERTLEEQRRLSTLGELSAVLAHEIRNPLASLKGHAQLLAERMAGDAPERSRVDRIVGEAQRLEVLTTDLLDFARTGPMDLQPVGVEAFLRDTTAEAVAGPVDLDLARAPERWPMDALRMRQVLSNLLVNAAEASPDGVPIQVGAGLEKGDLVITVRDQGDGIPAELMDRIFEPFYTTRTRGTGLGLAVARRIVELHGGTLTARSGPPGGAEFRIILKGRKEGR